MSDHDDIAHGSTFADSSNDLPPPDAEGLDRPSDNEDALDDTNNAFDGGDDDAANQPPPDDDDDDDDESLLSDVDEGLLDQFDENKLEIAPDFEQLKSTKIKKRKRDEGDEGRPKKKERTREKARRKRGESAEVDGADNIVAEGGKRRRGAGGGAGGGGVGSSGERKPRVREEVDEETLAPEERRRRALDRAMDAAVKKNAGARRKKGEIDLEQMADEELNSLRNRMVNAAVRDGELVSEGSPAFMKLKLLPEVTSLLHRTTYTQSILDPETNFLEPVRFFLEPLSDGSLPAYNIQRELFSALERLPMTKEALISSGIGKVIFFYRKSKRVDPKIKRQATKLMEEWSRPILGRSEDFSKKNWETVTYDPGARGAGTVVREASNAAIRKSSAAVGPGQRNTNRARMQKGVTSYSIVPQVASLPRR